MLVSVPWCFLLSMNWLRSCRTKTTTGHCRCRKALTHLLDSVLFVRGTVHTGAVSSAENILPHRYRALFKETSSGAFSQDTDECLS